MTVAPVVVKPLIDSNSALTGWASVESVPIPATMYGTAPTHAAPNQASATNSIASFGPRSGSPLSCSNASPTVTAIAIEMRNTTVSSP